MARQFNGTNSYLRNTTLSYGGSTSCSFAVSFIATTISTGRAMISAADDASFFFQIGGGVNPIVFYQATDGIISGVGSAIPIANGAFYRCVGTYNGSTFRQRLYRQGALVGDQSSGVVAIGPSTGLSIGRRGDGVYFGGSISAVAVWDSVELTADEAISYTNGLSPRFIRPAALTAFWKLDSADSNVATVGSHTLTAFNSPTDIFNAAMIEPGTPARRVNGGLFNQG